jgi:predicted alpha/beta hydrolase family esterase
MRDTLLILPGYGNSGPAHWQSLWQDADPTILRIDGQNWDQPTRGQWVENLEQTVKRLGPDTVLIAHSLACLQVAHWAQNSQTPIKAAMLVAVPEPALAQGDGMVSGFAPLPLQRLNFPTLVVASTNDPYGRAEYARQCADAWGSRYLEIGDFGHINGNSGLGDWAQGKAWLNQLLGN